MSRRLITSARMFPVVIAITLALALLPERWLGWTSIPAEIVGLPFGPFGEGLNRSSDLLRPPPPNEAGRFPSREEIDRLVNEKESYRQMLFAADSRNAELTERIQQLEGGNQDMPSTGVKPLSAVIVMRSPGAPFGTVVLNRGESHGVKGPAVAMYFGQLLGRIVRTTSVQSTLLPVNNPQNNWVTTVIRPKDKPFAPLESLKSLQFRPQSDGSFIAEPDKNIVISVGDLALLHDNSWPRSAQGARIGLVDSVQLKDSDPLRNVVIVRPQHQVAQVTYVTVLVDFDESGAAGAAGRTGGSP